MKIESIKQLDKLMALCQKRGVSSITVDGLTFHMHEVKAKPRAMNAPVLPDYSNDIPEASAQVPKFTGEVEEQAPITTEDLTPEQLLMWSSGSNEHVGQ